MPRPKKFDRTEKLVIYEISYIPQQIMEKKDGLHIYFGNDVPMTAEEIQEKLRKAIPQTVIVHKEEEIV
jgi:hypothetical protein